MSPKLVADALGWRPNAIYEAIKRGDIPHVDIGGRKRPVPTAWVRQKLGLGPAP